MALRSRGDTPIFRPAMQLRDGVTAAGENLLVTAQLVGALPLAVERDVRARDARRANRQARRQQHSRQEVRKIGEQPDHHLLGHRRVKGGDADQRSDEDDAPVDEPRHEQRRAAGRRNVGEPR